METFADRLNKAMASKGMTAITLAEETGLSKSRISHYVNGRYTPKSEALLKIAAALGVTEHWLMGSTEPTDAQQSEWDANSNSIMEESRFLDQMRKRYGKHVVQVVHDMEIMNEAGQQTAQGLVSDLAEVPYYKKGE